jgi:ABC-type antimicrobial peptide transport system permease subunit
MRSQILSIALIESAVAVTAAISLAVLNHIFAAQRQSEYGILHALGYGRPQLVWRALQETGLTTGAAWAISVVACLGGLLYMQFGMFAPLGLRLNLLNGTPWLFTLPIPAAVLAATVATTARTLRRLDPVSIVERRQIT